MRSILLSLIVALFVFTSSAQEPPKMLAYFGTLGNSGIYVSQFDPATGKLADPQLAGSVHRPSFLVITKAGDRLYATGQLEPGSSKTPVGALAAFDIDRATGKLTLINSRQDEGKMAAFVGLDRTEKFLLYANYGSGSGGIAKIESDGAVGPNTFFHQYVKGPPKEGENPRRQERSHLHSSFADPENRHILECDLGCDAVYVYDFDQQTGKVSNEETVSFPPGTGPRHLVFSKDGKFVYVVSELANTVTVFDYAAMIADADPKPVQTISTLPADFKGDNFSSEILLHPSGKFLYSGNRGHDSIAIFAVDQQSGKLMSLGQTPCGGKFPRNFGISPDGKWLIIANEQTSNVAVFSIDQETGAIAVTGESHHLDKPSCVRFVGIK